MKKGGRINLNFLAARQFKFVRIYKRPNQCPIRKFWSFADFLINGSGTIVNIPAAEGRKQHSFRAYWNKEAPDAQKKPYKSPGKIHKKGMGFQEINQMQTHEKISLLCIRQINCFCQYLIGNFPIKPFLCALPGILAHFPTEFRIIYQ